MKILLLGFVTSLMATHPLLSPQFEFAPSHKKRIGKKGVNPPRTWMEGSHISIINGGEQLYAERMNAIRNAKHSIYIQSLEIADDESSQYMVKLLKAKLSEGVEVKIIVDGLYTLRQPQRRKILFDLKNAGAEIRGYAPGLRQQFVQTMIRTSDGLNKRYHEKYLLIDSNTPQGIAFLGGSNYGNKFYRISTTPESNWTDQDLAVIGPAVQDVRRAFLRNILYFRTVGEKIEDRYNIEWQTQHGRCDGFQLYNLSTHDQIVQALGWTHPSDLQKMTLEYAQKPSQLNFVPANMRFINSRPRAGENYIAQTYINLINNTQKEIILVNSYLLPTPQILGALLAAAKRGVEITLVSNSKESTDATPPVFFSRLNYAQFLNINRLVGKEIFKVREWTGESIGEGMVHAKFGIFDRKHALVGSYNLDPRSKELNSEDIIIFDGDGVNHLSQIYEKNYFLKSREVDLENDAFKHYHPWIRKFLHFIEKNM